jgi:ADP-heptose:LPS heptosyltransferase
MDSAPILLSGTAPRRILVGLVEHFGDIVACEPVTRYLRFNFPDAHLSWVVLNVYRELIDSNPYVNETVTVECLTEWMRLASHGDYDQVVDLHVNYRICQHCQIPLTKRTGNPFVTAFEWFDHGAILEAFALGAGLPRLFAQPRVYLRAAHRGAVDALGLPTDYCVFHRVSKDLVKDWQIARWEAIVEIVKDELGLAVVEVGAGKREELPRPIEGTIDLVNRLPLLQTAEVIRRARFFVGIDSGPAHFANALEVPGVVLLGRIGYFRQYNPYTGFYASSSPSVKLVRNLVGPAADISVADVAHAVRYVAAVAPWAAPETAIDQTGSVFWNPPGDEHAADLAACGLFDVGWYALAHPELEAGSLHPIDHWLREGVANGESPSPSIDLAAYCDAAPDVRGHGVDPLLHYIADGCREGRPMPSAGGRDEWHWETAQATVGDVPRTLSDILFDGSLPEPASRLASAVQPRPGLGGAGHAPPAMPRVFAFYLPQFHPIPENDLAHGMGFTEWHNVINAKPLFRGHYQPRVPGELGFYDLRSEEVLRQQIALARAHGIDGFCFYYYNFQGRKLLYRPIDNFVRSDIDAPFLCVWANENWTKAWDGGDREVIIAQQHSDEDDLQALRDLATLFQDRRYLKIDGKPVMMVYKPHLFPDIRRSVETWRNEIIRYGFHDLFLVTVDDWPNSPEHPRDIGFDASYEIPSNIVERSTYATDAELLDLPPDFTGRIVDYEKFARFHMGRPKPRHRRFRTVMAPWDNTPRYGMHAMVQINGGGNAYQRWLSQALLDTCRDQRPEERIVFLHSWNEWCEGTYIEPDGRLGRLYLEQTREAINLVRSALNVTPNGDGAAVAAALLRGQRDKDRGAYQVMQATRMQTHRAYRDSVVSRIEAERLRAELAILRRNLERDAQGARRQAELLDAVYRSTSWRMTAPLRRVVTAIWGH